MEAVALNSKETLAGVLIPVGRVPGNFDHRKANNIVW